MLVLCRDLCRILCNSMLELYHDLCTIFVLTTLELCRDAHKNVCRDVHKKLCCDAKHILRSLLNLSDAGWSCEGRSVVNGLSDDSLYERLKASQLHRLYQNPPTGFTFWRDTFLSRQVFRWTEPCSILLQLQWSVWGGRAKTVSFCISFNFATTRWVRYPWEGRQRDHRVTMGG